MANAIYPKCKQKLLDANIDFNTDTLKVALIDTGTYTYNAADEFWSSASAAAVGTPQTLTNVTITTGAFDSDPATWTALSGATVEALIVYKDTGNAATSPLICYIDTGQTGLPLTPNGGDVTYTPGSNIFQL